jgi:sporulation protein YunB
MFKPKGRRPRKRIPFRHVFVITFILFIAMTIWGLWIINNGIKPTLMAIAENRAKQIATYAVNIAVGKKEIREMEQEMNQSGANGSNKLFIPHYDNNNNVDLITYNTVAINQLNNRIVNDVSEYLRLIEEGKTPISNPTLGEVKADDTQLGLVDKIPLGQATNNVLLSNLGPNIPVKFQDVSNITTNTEHRVQPIQINNIYVQIFIRVTVQVKIVIPFEVKTVSVTSDIPVAEQIMRGDVPIYWGGNSSSPSIVLPGKDSTGSSKSTTTKPTGKSSN